MIVAALLAAAPARAESFPIAEIMRATALDEIFTQFGAGIAAAARSEDVSNDEAFLDHWESTALAIFDAARLHERLTRALEGRFSETEQQALASFFRSGFGERMTVLERDIARLPPEAQLTALAAGMALAADAGAVRSRLFDDLVQLVGAEISVSMVGQSVRALLVALAVSQQQGDIEVPWPAIDAQIEAMMPGLLAEVSRTQRAMMAYAYRDLSDEDLSRYIAFLRTEPAQKLYGIAASAVGRIIADGMARFGDALSTRLRSVNI
ncbi:MAG: hypothetical protein IPK28_08900 [Devosia sp.]|nr:hypothetical protein [Devosia sp.]